MFKVQKLNVEKMVVLFFSLLPIVDSVNGILIRTGSFSISMAYKMFLMVLLLIPAIKRNKWNVRVLGGAVGLIIYILVSVLLNLLIIRKELIEVDFPIKMIFNIITFFLLWQNIENCNLSGKSIYKIFDNNVTIMMLSILVPYTLGLGYRIYSGGIGYKGFFYSQNELNAVLIILFYFCIFKISQKMTAWSIIQLVAIFVCVIMMNTKSSVIVCAVGGVIFVVQGLKKLDIRYKVVIAVAGAMVIFAAKDFILLQITSMLGRQNGLLNVYGGNVLATLTSGRIYFVQEAFEELMGRPLYHIHLLLGNGFISEVLTEMDCVDIFFYLGIVGVILVAFVLAWMYYKSSFTLRNDKNAIRKVGFLIIIAFSCITGHVLFMATSGCYFAMYCCFIMTYDVGVGGQEYECYI